MNTIPDEVLPRQEKLKKLDFPTSNEHRVIVRGNNEAIGFKMNCYRAEILQNFVEKNVFDKTVIHAQKICQSVWQQKKLQESSDQQEGSKYFLFTAFFLSIVSFILLIIVVYGTQDLVLLFIAIAIICLAGALTLFVAIKTLTIKPSFIDFEFEVSRRLINYLDSENQRIYLNKRLRWEMEPRFFWLELHIMQK